MKKKHLYVRNQKGIDIRHRPVYKFRCIHIQSSKLKDFDIKNTDYRNPKVIYTIDGKEYWWNFSKNMLVQVNVRNFYDYICIAPRYILDGKLSRKSLHVKYEPQNGFIHESMFMILGCNDFAYIMDWKDDILIKFYFDINRDLYWEKDLTSHGDLIDQLKFILGENEFHNMIENFNIVDPDYNLKYKSDSPNKNPVNIPEDEDTIGGFTVIDKNPYMKYLSKENKRSFIYGFSLAIIVLFILYLVFSRFLI